MLPSYLVSNPLVTQRAENHDGIDGRSFRTEFAKGFTRGDLTGKHPGSNVNFINLVNTVIANNRKEKKKKKSESTGLLMEWEQEMARVRMARSASEEAKRNLTADKCWDTRRPEDLKSLCHNLSVGCRLKWNEMEIEKKIFSNLILSRPLLEHDCCSNLYASVLGSEKFMSYILSDDYVLLDNEVIIDLCLKPQDGQPALVNVEFNDTVIVHSEFYAFKMDVPTCHCIKCDLKFTANSHHVLCWPSGPSCIIPRGDPHGNVTRWFKYSILDEYEGLRYGGALSMEAYASRLEARQKIMMNGSYDIVNVDSRVLQNAFVSYMRASHGIINSNLTLLNTGESQRFGIDGFILDCPSHGTLFSIQKTPPARGTAPGDADTSMEEGDVSLPGAGADLTRIDPLFSEPLSFSQTASPADLLAVAKKLYPSPNIELVTDACNGLNELAGTARAKRAANHEGQVGHYFKDANREERAEFEAARKALASGGATGSGSASAPGARSQSSRRGGNSLGDEALADFEDEHNDLRCAIPDIEKCSSGHAKGMALAVCDCGFPFRGSAMSLPRGEWFGVFDKMLFHIILKNKIEKISPVVLDYGCIFRSHFYDKFEGVEICLGGCIRDIEFIVDVLHAKGHIPSCRFMNGALYISGTGRIIGVQCERAWSRVSDAGASRGRGSIHTSAGEKLRRGGALKGGKGRGGGGGQAQRKPKRGPEWRVCPPRRKATAAQWCPRVAGVRCSA